jgi:POT family proton-dependent oligopeptide transporter
MSHAPSDVEPVSSQQNGRTLLGHPPGLFLLFAVEMWERFSYYGMRGLLVLYLIAVFAARELPKGVYTNDLEMTQVEEVGGKPMDGASRHQEVSIAVAQDGFTAPSKTVTTTGDLPVRIERVRLEKDAGGDSSKDRWVPAGVDVSAPIVVSGKPGEEFQGGSFAFRITNPTDKMVKLRVGIRRNNENAVPYLKVNKSPTPVNAEIKPDKELKSDADQFIAAFEVNKVSSGRFWTRAHASTLYGWYTGLAYLFPILGGIIADKLIGTHRSMLVGGLLISLGHIILGLSGIGELAHNTAGMSMFIAGLAVIVLGTGHFKPCVSVMVGQLYKPGDPRRDGAFTIFYMGINLGAFICAFVCGTLGEKVGWHWGFASAAAGMLAGLAMYMVGKPILLKGIGEAPKPPPDATRFSTMFFFGSVLLAALFGLAYHVGVIGKIGDAMDYVANDSVLKILVPVALGLAVLVWAILFTLKNASVDRGPVITIFVFMLFNAFFWIAFEQAGSSLNVFTEENTNRTLAGFEVPATWFQSVNAGLIFILAPVFAALWTALGKRRMNPSQPVKIALGLVFLGVGYIFMVVAGGITVGNAAKASMMFILMTYFWHTVGELCLSPTGLSYVTKAAPVQFVSLLMGIWFVSSFIANLGGGLIAAKVEAIEKGELKLPWHFGGQADYFFLFVVTSFGAALLMFLLTPYMKKLMRSPED